MVGGVDFDAFDGTHHQALRFFVVPDTFGTKIRVDLVDFGAHVDGGVRALGFADIWWIPRTGISDAQATAR